MTDPAKLRYVTEHYVQLQGLRLVPLGILFIGVALWHDGQLRWLPGSAGDVGARWFAAGLVLAIIAAHIIGAHYRREFGTVEPRPFRTGGPSLLANAVIVFGLAILQDAARWPVSLPLVYIGAVLAYTGIVQHELRKHYLWIAAACLLFATIQSFGVPPQTRRVMLDLLIAGSLIVAGVADHLALRKVLQPPQESQTYVDTAAV